MLTTWMLTKRNMKIYMRNRTLVFSSMFTILIIITLNIVFLQKMNVDSLTEMLSVSHAKATFLISSLTLAGILFTSTITVPLAVMATMIEDEEKKRMMAFVISPISRLQLTLGYTFASFLMGCAISFITLAISQGYLFAIGGTFLPFKTLFKLMGIIIITVFSSSSMVFFLTSFIRTSGSFSALNTILGTLIGFIAGIYLPMGMLPDMVQNILKLFPGLYGASLMREVYASDVLEEVFHLAPPTALTEYSNFMGITLTWNTHEVTELSQLLILLGSGILFIILSALVLSRKKTSDR